MGGVSGCFSPRRARFKSGWHSGGATVKRYCIYFVDSLLFKSSPKKRKCGTDSLYFPRRRRIRHHSLVEEIQKSVESTFKQDGAYTLQGDTLKEDGVCICQQEGAYSSQEEGVCSEER